MSKIDDRGYEHNPSLEGFMRALVVDKNDPRMEGRVGVLIPKIMPFVDPNMAEKSESTVSVNNNAFKNTEVTGLFQSTVTTTNAIWARPTFFTGAKHYQVPEKGTWVYVIAEDGDPNKLYYLPFGPTINGDVLNFDNIMSGEDPISAGKRPGLHVYSEFKDGFTHYYNKNWLEYELRHSNGTYLSLVNNDIERFFEVQLKYDGHRLRLDDINKHITILSKGGHMIELIDGDPLTYFRNANTDSWAGVRQPNSKPPKKKKKPKKIIRIKSAGGSMIEITDEENFHIKSASGATTTMDNNGNVKTTSSEGATVHLNGGNIKTTSSAGATVHLNGGNVLNQSSGGGKVAINGGNVMLN